MKKYQHVLFATDLDERSESAAEYARDFAALLDAKFSMLHIVQVVAAAYGYVGDYDFEQQIVEDAHAEMARLAGKLGVESGSCQVVKGYPKEDLLRKAKQMGVDLIILHGHRHHWLGMLGSTANSIVNKAECDVLVLSAESKN
ncbi:universal stress protein [Piscirickettsia litoralis]|uniref:Universal stress protein n=1 Tax=Piscirickettsia litoralis TaxID=1891921 RepID=A0ABX3A1M6_9GAMM|nr:universal stress protein [Piscirickettsia litoralis]ODN42127.1 universal stress family protein [Piscirickettsia litoralis]